MMALSKIKEKGLALVEEMKKMGGRVEIYLPNYDAYRIWICIL